MKIVSVAIRKNGKTYALPPPSRHFDLIRHLVSIGETKPFSGEEGFLACESNNCTLGSCLRDRERILCLPCEKCSFVTRIEAAKIALDSLQITKLSYPPRLYSEDIW